jgi:hypothetical protein
MGKSNMGKTNRGKSNRGKRNRGKRNRGKSNKSRLYKNKRSKVRSRVKNSKRNKRTRKMGRRMRGGGDIEMEDMNLAERDTDINEEFVRYMTTMSEQRNSDYITHLNEKSRIEDEITIRENEVEDVEENMEDGEEYSQEISADQLRIKREINEYQSNVERLQTKIDNYDDTGEASRVIVKVTGFIWDGAASTRMWRNKGAMLYNVVYYIPAHVDDYHKHHDNPVYVGHVKKRWNECYEFLERLKKKGVVHENDIKLPNKSREHVDNDERGQELAMQRMGELNNFFNQLIGFQFHPEKPLSRWKLVVYLKKFLDL